jgi:hypothetical protein
MEKLTTALGLHLHPHFTNNFREEANFKRWIFLEITDKKTLKKLKSRKKKLKSHKVTPRDLVMIASIFKKSSKIALERK